MNQIVYLKNDIILLKINS